MLPVPQAGEPLPVEDVQSLLQAAPAVLLGTVSHGGQWHVAELRSLKRAGRALYLGLTDLLIRQCGRFEELQQQEAAGRVQVVLGPLVEVIEEAINGTTPTEVVQQVAGTLAALARVLRTASKTIRQAAYGVISWISSWGFCLPLLLLPPLCFPPPAFVSRPIPSPPRPISTPRFCLSLLTALTFPSPFLSSSPRHPLLPLLHLASLSLARSHVACLYLSPPLQGCFARAVHACVEVTSRCQEVMVSTDPGESASLPAAGMAEALQHLTAAVVDAFGGEMGASGVEGLLRSTIHIYRCRCTC